jgi:5-methylcytosine-specific restriction endonuclease McrA
MVSRCKFPACACERQCRLAAPVPICAFPSCGCRGECRVATRKAAEAKPPKPPKVPAVTQIVDRALIAALGKPCPYCGDIMGQPDPNLAPTKDHILPRSRGGTLQPANCLIVCRGCNGEKADRTLDEFATWLRGRDDERYARVMHLLSTAAVAA